MPQRRKGRQTNNKKKKGKAGGNQARNNPKSSIAAPDTSYFSCKQPPIFQEYEDRRRQGLHQDFRTNYSRYKGSTKRFQDYMVKNTPESLEGNRKSVNFLLTAVDWMAENRVEMDPKVIKDLKLAIRIRSRIAEYVFEGGDDGHRHLLLVLRYCWTCLASLPRSSSAKVNQSEEHRAAQQENQYLALMDDDDQDDEVDEEMFPSTPVPRPELEPEIALTIDELLNSDERNDCILFLSTLDEIMGYVADHYHAVKETYLEYKQHGGPDSAIIEKMLEAAMATNMAIQQVQQLEVDLQQQHEYLTTPYRLLSTLVFPEITKEVAQIVRKHGFNNQSLEREVIIFLGDCFECHIRNRSDPLNQRDNIVQQFCTKFKINETGKCQIEKIFNAFEFLVVTEIPLAGEKPSREVRKMMQSKIPGQELPKDHSWLRNMKFIGGDRAIHHTIRLLQAFAGIIQSTPENLKIEAKKGFFGPSPWRPGRIRKIHGDLDELFMADILPQWVLMCRKGILGKMDLPRDTELCPLFVLFTKYVKNPDQPLSWSLAFGMHAMLTAILETDQVFNQLMNASEAVFKKYFSQLDFAIDLAKKEPEMSGTNKVWSQNIFMVGILNNLALDVFGRRALWNPLCGGTILSYLCFFGNLESGCTLVDCQAQLRITLHLFHALKINNLVEPGTVPILDVLHDCFKSSRGIWEGPLPKKGELVKRFWICFGMSVRDAQKMAEEANLLARGYMTDSAANTKSWNQRKMSPVEPAEIAKCYRRICNRDFHDVVDNYHTPEQRRRSKGTDMYSFAVRANDTMDAIEQEQKLLALNLPAFGAYIEQFVCSLGRIFQWEPLLADPTLDQKRQGYVVLFAQHLLGTLDFSPNPFSHEFLNVPIGEASLLFLTKYFNSVDEKKLFWFTPVEEY